MLGGICLPQAGFIVKCEEKVAAKKAAAAQLALPDDDPKRVFTDAQIRDVEQGYCNKRGESCLLLRELRRRLGLV